MMSLDMEDYWNEYRTIGGRRADHRGSHSEEESRSHDDESDDILDTVFSSAFRGDREISETELVQSRFYSTLTTRQKEQIIRRAQARNFNTLRQKRLKCKERKPNVWSVFSTNDNSSTGSRSRSATPDSLDSISPPRTPPDPSTKEWIEPHLSRSRASLDSGHHSLITPPSSSFSAAYPTSPLEDYSINEDPHGGRHKKLTRTISPPQRLEKYSYATPDEDPRIIYRAPSVDVLAKVQAKNELSRYKDNVRRQHSYHKDAKDVKSYYVNKGIFEVTPQLAHNEEVRGLRYQQIGSLYLKNIYRNKIPDFEHSYNGFIDRKSPGTVRRALSVKHVSKDPFSPKEIFEIRKHSQEDYRRASNSSDSGFKIFPTEENHDFPDIELEENRCGHTKINWIHNSDLERLRTLAILEIDIIFSENSIQHSWKKRSRKKKLKEDQPGVFGVQLESLIERDRFFLPDPFMETDVPLIAHKLITHLELRGLKEEGILRIPGQKAKTEELRRTLNQQFYAHPEGAESALREASANELAALVKQFLRELPQPMLTYNYAHAFYKVHKISDIEEKILALTMLIILLPGPYRDTLRKILDLCAKIVNFEKENKMGLYNVAMILTPNIFLPSFQPKHKHHLLGDDKDLLSAEKEYAKVTTELTQAMIKYREILWTVPPRLVSQVRRQYEDNIKPTNNKSIHRLLHRRPKDLIQRPIANEVDFQNGIIRISAPQFNKSHCAVKLHWHVTAHDIIEKFIEEQAAQFDNPHRVVGRREQKLKTPSVEMTTCLLRGSIKHALHTHFLHEKGGNIGERRIDHKAELIHVYQENPNGEFFVKCHHPGGLTS